MVVSPLLFDGLWKLINRDNDITVPSNKVNWPAVPQHQPNRHHQNSSVIEEGLANINSDTREVYIAHRVVGGGAGDGLFGRLEKLLTGPSVANAPNPLHHWCVVVGDYLHQLQATSLLGGWNYYTNERFGLDGGWTKYKLGATNFNDVAILNAASNAMNEMDEVYNVLDNNCQHFVLRLVDKILRDGRKKLKIVNGTVASVSLKPMMPRINGDGEVPEVKVIDPVVVKAPSLEKEEDVVMVGDENYEVAVVESDEDHKQMILNAVAIMISNTPSVGESMPEPKQNGGQ